MTSSTSPSASDSEEDRKKRKKSSKSKKHKSKEKKHKKKSGKKRHKRSSSSDSEGSSYEEEWVVPGEVKPKKLKKLDVSKSKATPAVTSKEEEESWNEIGDMFSSKPKKEIKKGGRNIFGSDRKNDDELCTMDRPGQHSKELNPYWKDGGSGLPSTSTNEAEEEPIEKPNATTSTTVTQASSVVGDGGLSWLRKSYIRAKQEAEEKGKSFEEIAESRWGSLENFYKMLEEAELKSKLGDKRGESTNSSSNNARSRFRRPDDDDKDKYGREKEKRSGDRDRDKDYSRRDRDRDFSRRDRDRERDRPSWRKETHNSSTSHRDYDDRNSRTTRTDHNDDEITRIKQDLNTNIKRIADRDRDRATNYPDKSQHDEENPNSPMEVQEGEEKPPNILTDKEMNELGAKILKAELMGNEELETELKEKLDKANKDREEWVKSGGKISDKPVRVITKVIMDHKDSGGGGRRKKSNKSDNLKTHQDGERVRYFPDDDKYTLQKMFEREKMNTVEDENALFSKLAGKVKTNSDYDMDDYFVDKASSSKQSDKEKQNEVRKILDEEKEYKKTIENCQWCFDGKRLEKNLIISTGEKSFICVPPFQSLTEGHCLIVPMYHTTCSTQLDEDVWEEMQKFRQSLVRMYESLDQDCVIFEMAVFLKNHPHMYLECVPMPKEVGELSPIYFKKAIQECETEWASNKKLVDLRGKDVRRCVPKGLPYFSVDFGTDSGFAHVIEDEYNFPKNFACEIVGGMMELDHSIWRKRKQDDFKTQRGKLMSFLKTWGPYDFTRD